MTESTLPLVQAEAQLPDSSTDTGFKSWLGLGLLGASLVLGVLGDVFFYSLPTGLNIPLYVALLIGAGLGFFFYASRKPGWANLALFIPALFFAAMFALRDDSNLAVLNLLLLMAALLLGMRFSGVKAPLGGSALVALFASIELAIIGWIDGPLTVLYQSSLALPKGPSSKFNAILRGLLITLPVLVVFGVLLGASDRVFEDALSSIFERFMPEDFDDLISHLFVIGFFTWFALGALKLMAFGPLARELETSLPPTSRLIPRWLGMIEAGMLLGGVNLLFLAYGGVQARYLFGGESNITERGYTYAEYARRGFFELVAVSVLTFGMVVALDWMTKRDTPRQETVFRGLTLLMIALTGVMIAAAWQRLALYQDAYGFTRTRVAVGVFMLWLTVLFGLLVLDLLVRNRRILWTGALIVFFAYPITLNLLNMDAFIATRNIEQWETTGKLDTYYLMSLSDDAIPVLVRLLDEPEFTTENHSVLRNLAWELQELDRSREKRTGLGYHIGKARAWKALDEHRALLEPYFNYR